MPEQADAAAMAPSPGQRIIYAANRGTVRFVGEIDGRAGTWVGIEWDDEARGKHDGEVDGRRYFHCSRPGTGSFLRPSAKLITGVSFLGVLRGKYLAAEIDSRHPSSSAQDASPSLSESLAQVGIEAPNLDKVRRRLGQLAKLRSVGLEGSASSIDAEEGCNVSKAFDDGEPVGSIMETCPNIVTLDLSRSLLPTWTELASIAAELPRLEALTFHFNRLAPLEPLTPVQPGAFSKLRELRIDGNDITWQQLLRLEPHLPALETLQCGYNGIAQLGEAPRRTVFSKLRELNLEGNTLAAWDDIVSGLGRLPRLNRLLLTSNPLMTVSSPIGATELGRPFPSLSHVALGGAPLCGWSDLTSLDSWLRVGRDIGDGTDGLQSLRLALPDGRRALLPDLEAKQFRALCIVLLPRLEQLDGGDITRAERLDAELRFVSRFASGFDGIPQQDLELFRARHRELVAAHGADVHVSDTQAQAPSQTTLQSKLVALVVHLAQEPPSTSPPHLPSLTRTSTVKLLPSTSLRQARARIQRALGSKASGQLWALLAPAPSSAEEQGQDQGRICFELEDLSREISHYGLSSGDEVILVIEGG